MRERRMQHPDEGTIHSWLDGALTAQESAEVEAHVQNCAECAVAVAEARGFIAGASRILTALDSVPSGVLPVANRRKGGSWPVWRAAAAVIVVALGSFVVLRDRVGRTEDRTSQFSVEPAISSQTTAPQTPSASALSAPVLSAPEKTQPQVKAPVEPPRTARAVGSRIATTGTENSPVVSGAQKSAANVRENASAPPVAGIVSTGEPVRLSRGGAAMDEATISPVPRDVGRRRAIGASSTFYELSPGDTVVLTEATELRLESAVVTGAGVANQPSVVIRGATGLAKSAAPDTQRTVVAPQNAQSTTQSSAQSATPLAAPTVPAAVGAAGMANPYNTISWVDSATGKRMSLSGRHSVRELEEIRQKIERLRAAQAAEKKSP
jgi:hypothetical protein